MPATYRRVWDFSRDGIRRSLEESLERLSLDRVDIVYLHDPDDHWQEVVETGYPALAELRGEGLIGGIGAGMNQSEMLADLVRCADVDLVMLAGRYTLLEQGALDDLLPSCEAQGVAVVAAGIFNSGLLARPYPAEGATYDYGEASGKLLRRARDIAAVCERHGTTLPAVAIAFPLAHPSVASVCVGARSPGQIERNANLYRQSIATDLWNELKAARLLRDDAADSGLMRLAALRSVLTAGCESARAAAHVDTRRPRRSRPPRQTYSECHVASRWLVDGGFPAERHCCSREAI